jgi:hypothetical protein
MAPTRHYGWVDRGLIVPILGGLDEMPEPVQAPVVTPLTTAVGRDRPLVLTSRADEYQAAVAQAGGPLARAAVVEIEPVTAADAAAYLPGRSTAQPGGGRCGPTWPPTPTESWPGSNSITQSTIHRYGAVQRVSPVQPHIDHLRQWHWAWASSPPAPPPSSYPGDAVSAFTPESPE